MSTTDPRISSTGTPQISQNQEANSPLSSDDINAYEAFVELFNDNTDGYESFLQELFLITQGIIPNETTTNQQTQDDGLDLNDVFALLSNQLTDTNTNSSTLESQPNYLELIGLLTNEANNLAQQAAFQEAFSAYKQALIEVQGQQNLLEMNNQSTEANAILDQQMLALRNNYLVLSKQLEQYVLDAQTRERITNLLFELTFNQTTNRFQLSKTVVNAAKY